MSVAEHCKQYAPAFARLKPLSPGKRLPFEPLGVRLDTQGRSPRIEPINDDPVSERFVGLCTAHAIVGDDGSQGPPGQVRQLFMAATEIALCPERFIALAVKGESILGALDVGSAGILVLSLPYHEVATVELKRKRKTFGGTKGTGVIVSTNRLSRLHLEIEQRRESDGSPGPRVAHADVFTAVVGAATVAWRRRELSPAEATRLSAIEAGHYAEDEHGSAVAWFVDPGAGPTS